VYWNQKLFLAHHVKKQNKQGSPFKLTQKIIAMPQNRSWVRGTSLRFLDIIWLKMYFQDLCTDWLKFYPITCVRIISLFPHQNSHFYCENSQTMKSVATPFCKVLIIIATKIVFQSKNIFCYFVILCRFVNFTCFTWYLWDFQILSFYAFRVFFKT
jgi:hypothetical protein